MSMEKFPSKVEVSSLHRPITYPAPEEEGKEMQISVILPGKVFCWKLREASINYVTDNLLCLFTVFDILSVKFDAKKLMLPSTQLKYNELKLYYCTIDPNF